MRGKGRNLQDVEFGQWNRCLAYARRAVHHRRLVQWSGLLDQERTFAHTAAIERASRFLSWIEDRIEGSEDDIPDNRAPLDAVLDALPKDTRDDESDNAD